jgi:hypothetical protein
VTGADAAQLQVVEAAANALMMHLRSHWTGLGQDRPFWQAQSAVPFWPATLGVPGRWWTGVCTALTTGSAASQLGLCFSSCDRSLAHNLASVGQFFPVVCGRPCSVCQLSVSLSCQRATASRRRCA